MNTPILDAPVRWWRCPSCETTDCTQRADPHTQMHHCSGLGGIALPLQEVCDPADRPKARHVGVMCEDYVGIGSPLTAINTERIDGSNDCTVLAETAIITLK